MKKPSHRNRQDSYHIIPIGQALAPYLAAGCRAVTGPVPRALFIGVIQLQVLFRQQCILFLL